MKNLLLNGCYDLKSVQFFYELGVRKFSFDLRPKSLNLIPFSELQIILKTFSEIEVAIIFQDESPAIMEAFMDLLNKERSVFYLQSRGKKDLDYYQNLKAPWYWMYDPSAKIEEIFHLRGLKGILLPLKYRSQYVHHQILWEQIERLNFEVKLHAESFSELYGLDVIDGLELSVDLDPAYELHYRQLDFQKIKKLDLWRSLAEGSCL